MSVKNGIRSRAEIEHEIKMTNVALHTQFNDADARNFNQGRLTGLRWVLKLEE